MELLDGKEVGVEPAAGDAKGKDVRRHEDWSVSLECSI